MKWPAQWILGSVVKPEEWPAKFVLGNVAVVTGVAGSVDAEKWGLRAFGLHRHCLSLNHPGIAGHPAHGTRGGGEEQHLSLHVQLLG